MNTVMTFEDSVKKRLKSIVADLIPEERWDGLVRATVDALQEMAHQLRAAKSGGAE